jgi:hypothetical protein
MTESIHIHVFSQLAGLFLWLYYCMFWFGESEMTIFSHAIDARRRLRV